MFDIETTGINAQNERITEIGALKISGGEIKKSFKTFVNPQSRYLENLEITGITNEMVKDAPDKKDCIESFDFVGTLAY